jgi:hypothetical protein
MGSNPGPSKIDFLFPRKEIQDFVKGVFLSHILSYSSYHWLHTRMDAFVLLVASKIVTVTHKQSRKEIFLRLQLLTLTQSNRKTKSELPKTNKVFKQSMLRPVLNATSRRSDVHTVPSS